MVALIWYSIQKRGSHKIKINSKQIKKFKGIFHIFNSQNIYRLGSHVMAQLANPLPASTSIPYGSLVLVLAAPFQSQLPIYGLGRQLKMVQSLRTCTLYEGEFNSSGS